MKGLVTCSRSHGAGAQRVSSPTASTVPVEATSNVTVGTTHRDRAAASHPMTSRHATSAKAARRGRRDQAVQLKPAAHVPRHGQGDGVRRADDDPSQAGEADRVQYRVPGTAVSERERHRDERRGNGGQQEPRVDVDRQGHPKKDHHDEGRGRQPPVGPPAASDHSEEAEAREGPGDERERDAEAVRENRRGQAEVARVKHGIQHRVAGESSVRDGQAADDDGRRVNRTPGDDPVPDVPRRAEDGEAGNGPERPAPHAVRDGHGEQDGQVDEAHVLGPEGEPDGDAPDEPIRPRIAVDRDEPEVHRRGKAGRRDEVHVSAHGLFEHRPREHEEERRIHRVGAPRPQSTSDRVQRDGAEQPERQLTSAREQVAVPRRHQPQKEELAVGRRVGLRLVAEGRRDDGNRMILQPARREIQVIAQRVVERPGRVGRRKAERKGHERRGGGQPDKRHARGRRPRERRAQGRGPRRGRPPLKKEGHDSAGGRGCDVAEECQGRAGHAK